MVEPDQHCRGLRPRSPPRAEATAAKAANASNHRELAVNATKKCAACYTVYTAGYDIAAAACGDNFLPAGFTEFAGWSDSAKQILRFITHKGDCLKADEEGERFDAGAEATWATRKHRSFMINVQSASTRCFGRTSLVWFL